MADMVMNTNTLPESIFKMIPTVKVRVKKVSDEVHLIPVAETKKRPCSEFIGLYEGKVWMADDFDAPLEEFKEYME